MWFGAYAPADKPEIVVVAFGEHTGGGGGKTAAPMVLKVIEAYFNGGKPLPTTLDKDGKKLALPRKIRKRQ